MPRLMSFALTEQSFLDGTKTQTRRLGWWTDKNGRRLLHAGDRITGCRKVMGRRDGEPLVRLGQALVSDIYRQRLSTITDEDVIREGVPVELFDEIDNTTGQPPTWEWVRWFCEEQRCTPDTEVTVIEFYRVPPSDFHGEASCEDWCQVQCQGMCGGFVT